jgi:hypothetical protein
MDQDCSRETTSVGRLLHFPDVPDVPEALRGGSFALVEAFHIGDEREGAEILRPLRELRPVLDTFAMIPPVGLAEIDMDPPEPLAYLTDHLVLGDLTRDTLDDLVGAVGPGSGSTLDSVEIRHVGGAMGRAEETHGALAKLPGEYIVFGIGVADDAAAERRVRTELDAMIESVRPDASGLYFNFTEYRVDPASIFAPERYRRLRAVRRARAPDNRFRANHSLPPEDDAAAPELLASRREAHVVSNSLTVTIDATVNVTELAVRRLDLAKPALRALEELGLKDRVTVRRGGLTWHQRNGHAPIDIDVDIRVEPHGDDGSSLSIATRFSAADESARLSVLDAWALVGPVSATLAERAARSVKAYAERDTYDDLQGLEAQLRAA